MQISDYLQTGIASKYTFGTQIGEGGFATVCKATHNQTEQPVAVKILAKSMMNDRRRFENQVQIITALDHPNIIKIYQIYEEHDSFCIVMELMEGGDLLQRIEHIPVLSEQIFCDIFRPVLDAVRYCHQSSIVHRDLKPQNILFTSFGPDGYVKITDFGLARLVGDELMTTACGTFNYMAPQILLGHPYTQAVDYWSLGVILYLMLTGKLPFHDTRQNTIKKIIHCQPDYGIDTWKGLSNQSKDLCKGLLCKNPAYRYKLKDILAHPWMVNGGRFGNTLFDLHSKIASIKLMQRLASDRRTTASIMQIQSIRKECNITLMEMENNYMQYGQ